MEKVTDPHLIKLIKAQGRNEQHFSLLNDYSLRSQGKEHSPYARFYRDELSSTRLMTVDILPKVSAAGFNIVPKWRSIDNRFVIEENCFEVEVEDRTVTSRCVCDQATGIKKDDQAIWRPRLFLDNVEVHPINDIPSLLDIDPINPDLYQNTIEWDYNICKRRIRILPGRFRERWLTYYRGLHEIRHNFTGNLPIKLGYCVGANGEPIPIQVTDSSEIIDTINFPDSVFPIEIGATATFTPDTGTGSTTVDGPVQHSGPPTTWAAVRGGAGTEGFPSLTAGRLWTLTSAATSSKWGKIVRSIFLFDTSSLPDAAVITAATFSVYGDTGADPGSWSPDANVYSSAPASDNDLVAGDYDSLGTTAYCDTAIAYASWDSSGWNDWTLNSTGIAAITKTDVTKLGLRNANYDVANTEPSWGASEDSYNQGKYADYGSVAPKLVVTYASDWDGGDVIGVSSSNIVKVNSITIANIEKINEVS
tara:strand:- start:236 stop:1666 length:1431 start_codon:yes stop_codon:yes gene_type:complete